MARPERILIRTPNWIGDHVMADDLYAALRSAFPQCVLTAACPAEWAELVQQGPFDEVLPLTRDHRRFPTGLAFWARGIRARRFDTFLCLPASWSAGLLGAAAGIARRIGYAEPGSGWLWTQSLPWQGRASGKHKAQLYRDLLTLLAPASAPERPTLGRRTTEARAIVLAPGASIALREWPGFVELARALRDRYPQARLQIVGTSAQSNWEEKFLRLEDPLLESLVGRTTLPELVEVCRSARFVVANDSGVAHVAARLAGAPTVVLFGPGDPAYVAPPGAVVARADVPCSPCEKPFCKSPFGYQFCLRSLSVEDVLRRIATLD